MIRRGMLVALVGVVLSSTASAQAPGWRFRWQAGQVLTYRVEQVTSASEEVGATKNNSTSKMSLVKRWQVLQVDPNGVATVQLALTSLRLETTSPENETLVFDTANLEKSNPEMREQMQRYVGQPLAVLRIDPFGRVVEVKEAKHGPASRYLNELPFAVALPGQAPQPGQSWERPYQTTLEPPQGTGEKFDAVQRYTCTQAAGNTATITLTTAIKSKLPSPADEIPLLQMQPQGEVVFDVQAGILRSAKLTIDKEVKDHQGENSRYRYQSTFSEEYVPNQ